VFLVALYGLMSLPQDEKMTNSRKLAPADFAEVEPPVGVEVGSDPRQR
jgi:hypothetical protein